MMFVTATNTPMASDLATLTRIRHYVCEGSPGTPDRADPNMVIFKLSDLPPTQALSIFLIAPPSVHVSSRNTWPIV